MKQIIAIITLTAFMFACGGKKEETKVDEVKEQVEETVNEISDNVEEAVNYVKSKKMIAFMSEGNTYLVFNTDGSYANKALAIALEDGVVKIKGKVNSVGGMNTIIADVIE